jgi:import inner membrane translocase subunit TIM16
MISQRTGMTLDEASKILDIPPNAPLEDIVKKYETLYNANEESQGGSFYLQSKIVRARERLELELQEKADQLKESSASQ